MDAEPPSSVDLRGVARGDRHLVILEAFDRLHTSGTIEVIGDHDPGPLYSVLRAFLGCDFGWRSLEHGPVTWRVAVKRLGTIPCGDGCAVCADIASIEVAAGVTRPLR